jgi:ribosomal protein S18 acetylase RimI-like enzyme
VEVTIRAAAAGDDAALRGLDHVTWSPRVTPGPWPPTGAPFFTHRTRPADVLIARAGGQIVGYVELGAPSPLPAHTHVMEIRGLAVDPGHQRRGVASALLRAGADEARRRGARKLKLRVLGHNVAARALYERFGFTVEGVLQEEFLLDGAYVDDVLMALVLTGA